jgi:metal-dependent amidase/aminoacylase/carboxypeptidase family protein
LKERVLACLKGGADAAGCTMTHDWKDPAYADLLANEPFMRLYRDNAKVLGRDVLDPRNDDISVVGSTDMGNVSHLVPSIHPMIKVSPVNVSIHTPEFAGFARAEVGDQAVIDGAKAMAMTVADLWLQPDVLTEVKGSFGAAGEG